MNMSSSSRRLASRQQGAALLIAMLIVALVSTIAASMVWKQWQAIQAETADRGRSQSYWLLFGATDWARMPLREDLLLAKGNPDALVDSLGEPWALPVAESRLSTFLAKDQQNTTDNDIEAFLSGAVTDLQGRYNLTNVLDDKGQLIPSEVQMVKRLCDVIKAPPGTAELLVNGMQKSWVSSAPPSGDAQSGRSSLSDSMSQKELIARPEVFDDVAWFGLSPEVVRQLDPVMTLLPEKTTINVNTAPIEVLSVVSERLDGGTAQFLLQSRKVKPYANVDAVIAAFPVLNDLRGRLGVGSLYFEIKGRLRLNEQVIEAKSFVYRSMKDSKVTTWHRQRINTVLSDKTVP